MSGGKMSRFVESMRSPRIEHGRQHHFVLKRRTIGPRDGLQSLERIRHDAGAHNNVKAIRHRYILIFVIANQFSAECNPPAPARNSMFDFTPSTDVEQFQRQAPQWMHFSRSNAGVPASPSVIAWPEHMSMQVFA